LVDFDFYFFVDKLFGRILIKKYFLSELKLGQIDKKKSLPLVFRNKDKNLHITFLVLLTVDK